MILNLTQHPATVEQHAEGVFDLEGSLLQVLKQALTFDALPTAAEIADRVSWLSGIALEHGTTQVMIGGAGYLMGALETDLRACGIEPLHAFTRREVVETTGPDGSVTKTAVFRHAGWVRT